LRHLRSIRVLLLLLQIPSHADQGSELMPIRKMIESGMM
jgi:hypothetical protein